MNEVSQLDPFTPLFDRSAQLCAQVQALVRQSAAEIARARALRLASRSARLLASEARMNLEAADILFTTLRGELESAVTTLRDAGLDEAEAEAAVRARVRFVLYDDGFSEVEAEPVVDHATAWVKELYEAA
jgi:hypothetical protein